MRVPIRIPKFSLWSFCFQMGIFLLLYFIPWAIIMPGDDSLFQLVGDLSIFILSATSATARLYFRQKSYITQLEQAIYHAANNIDLIRQHLNSLKHDSHSYEGNLPSTLVSQIHRYEDHLTTSKMTYNKSVRIIISLLQSCLITPSRNLNH